MTPFNVEGQYVDIPHRQIFPARITIINGRISAISKMKSAPLRYFIPGFIDAHVHIESSLLVPSEFARMAVRHGTVATVSDPHEIANVCGMKGVEYMIDNGKKVNFKFFFGAPSCVPATSYETAGGEISTGDIADLLSRKEVLYLAEMMNWPGTVQRDPIVMEKISLAQKYHKPVDGHAPGLKGDLAQKYVSAGISTDHECVTAEEALEKLHLGMKIIIREGSAAKNFDALIGLIDGHSDQIMFCSDDKHPDSLEMGHINQLVSRAIAQGKDIFSVLKAACLNPIYHYQLPVGRLLEGDWADFIVVNDLVNFEVLQTYINGEKVAEKGKSLLPSISNLVINNFNISKKESWEFAINAQTPEVRIIGVLDGQLITPEVFGEIELINGQAHSNLAADILKIAVVNRYSDAPPAVAFIKNFGLREGAIASSVGHDSHNIIAVGVDDESITQAVNLLVDVKGGLSAVSRHEEKVLPLEVAGLMSTEEGQKVARNYTSIDLMAKDMGSTLHSPFMTLSFMALLVIPDLKLSDKGLFNGLRFEFVDLFTSRL
jgi:adenine deaminase